MSVKPQSLSTVKQPSYVVYSDTGVTGIYYIIVSAVLSMYYDVITYCYISSIYDHSLPHSCTLFLIRSTPALFDLLAKGYRNGYISPHVTLPTVDYYDALIFQLEG